MRVEISGIREITTRLRNTAGFVKAIDDTVGGWVSKFVTSKLAGAKNYAPSPAGSSYMRTYRLGAGWEHVRSGFMSFAIRNATSYAMFVVGDSEGKRQARVHAGRWWVARDRLNQEMPVLLRAIKSRIKLFLGG